MKSNDKSDRRVNSKGRRSVVERVVLYAACLLLLGTVTGLAVKCYRLEDKFGGNDELQVTESTSGADTEASTDEAANSLPLAVAGAVEYNTFEAVSSDTEGEESVSTDNGEDLADNGCTYAIKINRQENIVTVYTLGDDGYYSNPVRAMRCSVSPDGETPLGLFNISAKWEWLALFNYSYGQYVSQIEGDTLFHSVPYTNTTKDSLETWEFNKLGTAASLGCIRLCVADTKWIYDNCEAGTYVNIFDSDYYGPLGRPVPVTRLEDTENEGWDPTDMDEENPLTGTGVIYGAESHTIKQGENYDTMAGVMAFNSNREDVTDQLTVAGTVDNTVSGDYDITYSFSDNGKEVTKTIVITVEDDEAPVIIKIPKQLEILNYTGQQDELAELIASYVTTVDSGKTMANDAVCVDAGSVKTEAGVYVVTCYAVDASGNKSDVQEIEIVISE